MPRKKDHAYKTENSVFASRLREIMKERGENQTTLAEKITAQYVTIQRQTISLYMSGQSKPDTERLTAIARVLDVSADWLLGLTEHHTQDISIRNICNYLGIKQKTAETLSETMCLEYAHTFLDALISERELRLLDQNIKRAILANIAYNRQRPGSVGAPLPIEEISDMDPEEYKKWLKDTLQKLDTEGKRFDADLEAGEDIYISFDDAASLFTERASGLLDGILRIFIDDISFNRGK